MQARLGFSVAAHMDPEILLVDEVLSVGDAAFRAKCLRHMEQLIHSDVSVIFISHNLEQVRHLCSRAIVLDRGSIRYQGNVNEACDEYYQTFANAAETQANNIASSGEGTGVIRTSVSDEIGDQTFRVFSNRPIAVDIQYHLHQDVPGVGLIVRFVKVGGTVLTACSTIHNGILIPSSTGTHAMRLHIDGLPFASGDYLMTVQLVNQAGAGFGRKPSPCPIAVSAPYHSHWDMFVDHQWESINDCSDEESLQS
jgi:lipopolysaccharide transport system ATP-binding protein